MELRNNQIPAYEAGIKYFKEKKPKPSLIVAPVAFGKSIVISKLAHFLNKDPELNGKVLVIQPSKELLIQNFEKLKLLGGEASIYSASLKSKTTGDITYATIGSIKNLGGLFKSLNYKYCIIDEADRFPREIDGMLRTFLVNSGISHVLGFTATPVKLQNNTDINGESYSKLVMLTSRSKKGKFFSDIIYVSQISEMLENKFWSNLIYKTEKFDETQLDYNTAKSEFTEKSLKEAYKNQDIEDKIVREINNLTLRKSILIAVPSVAEAISLSQRIPGSEVVLGETDPKERDRIIKEFKNLTLRIVINVNVLTIGFDHPLLDTLICGRSTASLSWYYQFLGRVTRIHPDKANGLIIDFSGNVDRFGKIETFKYIFENGIWKLFGEDKLLTGIPLHEIGLHKTGEGVTFNLGKYKGKLVSEAPLSYLNWMLQDFTFTDYNKYIKDEIIRLKSL